MSVPRIELADPGAEGHRIAEMLRERGLYVVERSIESLREGSDAALLLLAADAEGALEALAAIRAAAVTATTPVILLGDPPGEPGADRILAVGADAYYPRPVSIERLVRRVEEFIGSGPETEGRPSRPIEATMPLGEPSIAEWKPPERTMQLAHEQSSSPIVADSPRSSGTPPRSSHGSTRPSRPPTRTPPPPSSNPPPSTSAADLSPRLRRLILDADRRVFPASPPLDLRFPAGGEPAHELVPDELLETVSLPTEPLEEDPLDAFTYLGPVPEHAGTPLPGGSPDPNKQWLSRASSEPGLAADGDGGPVRTAATFAPPRGRPRTGETRGVDDAPSMTGETQDEIGFGERTRAGRGRYGEIGEADALRLLWRVVGVGDDVWLSLELESVPPLRLRIADGELCGMEGPVAQRVLARLRAQGRVDDVAADEDEAVRALEQRVASGTLGRFELDRLLRRAREELLHDVVAAGGGRFEMRHTATDELPGPRLLGAPLAAVLVEGARRRLTASRVRRLLGSGALAVRLTPIARDRFERAALEPELVSLLERCDGATLDALLAAAPPEEGVAGAVFALVAGSALQLVSAEQDIDVAPDPAAAVRAAVESAAALVEEGHYFAILGVRPDVSSRELRAAYEARRHELHQLRLAVHGLEDLEPLRRLALDGIDEAWEVLRNDRLRSFYRHALFGSA